MVCARGAFSSNYFLTQYIQLLVSNQKSSTAHRASSAILSRGPASLGPWCCDCWRSCSGMSSLLITAPASKLELFWGGQQGKHLEQSQDTEGPRSDSGHSGFSFSHFLPQGKQLSGRMSSLVRGSSWFARENSGKEIY